MDDDLYTLYNFAMGQLMEKECKKFKYFFSQEEFEENRHVIGKMKLAKNRLIKKLEDNEKKG